MAGDQRHALVKIELPAITRGGIFAKVDLECLLSGDSYAISCRALGKNQRIHAVTNRPFELCGLSMLTRRGDESEAQSIDSYFDASDASTVFWEIQHTEPQANKSNQNGRDLMPGIEAQERRQ